MTGCSRQRLQAASEPRLQLTGFLQCAFVAHRFQVGDACRHRQRMTGVGVAAHERVVIEVLRDRFTYQHATERHVSGGDTFGEHDHVGRDVEHLGCEPVTQAPEAGHHLVEHQDDAVALGDLAHSAQVTFGIADHAVGADQRLDEQRRDVIGPLEHDHLLEVLQGAG